MPTSPAHAAGALALTVALACSRGDAPAPRPAFVPPDVSLDTVPELRITSPVGSDCNRPSFWIGDTFYQITSNQHAWRSRGGADAASAQDFVLTRFEDDDPAFAWDSTRKWYVHDINSADRPTQTQMRWIESAWRNPRTGAIYGLYHTEEGPYLQCPKPYERPYLTVAHIGLAKSTDDARSWKNLGLIVSDGTFPVSCNSAMRFFTGGVGDPSMAVDIDERWAYIAFTDYSGEDPATQGIELARIAVADLDAPLNPDGTSKALRWWRGTWSGPGLQGTPPTRIRQTWPEGPLGRATPILPPAKSWQRADGGGFWGPSLSWNVDVGAFMLLLNNVTNGRDYDAEGNYLTWLPDMRAPAPVPARPIRLNSLPNGPSASWYVQALGDPRIKGTSMRTGDGARLFMGDKSSHVLRFTRAEGR